MLGEPLEVGVLLVDVVAMVVPVLERLLALLQQVEPRLGGLRLERGIVLEIVVADVVLDAVGAGSSRSPWRASRIGRGCQQSPVRQLTRTQLDNRHSRSPALRRSAIAADLLAEQRRALITSPLKHAPLRLTARIPRAVARRAGRDARSRSACGGSITTRRGCAACQASAQIAKRIRRMATSNRVRRLARNAFFSSSHSRRYCSRAAMPPSSQRG